MEIIGSYDFQLKLSAIMVTDKDFVGGVYDVLNPKYFDNQELNQIIKFIINYYKKYLTIPTRLVLADWLEEKEEEEQALFLNKVEEILSIINKEDNDDFEYIKDKAIDFIEKQEVVKHISDLLGKLDSGDYDFDDFRHKIALTGGIGKHSDIGSEYVETLERRYSENPRNPIPTFSSVLNKYFDGGLGIGELGVIQAPTNIGKSFLLTYLTVEAIRLGYKVLYISLEMEEDFVNTRADARLCDIDLGSQKHNIEEIREKILEYKKSLYTKRMSEESTNTNTVRAYLKKLETRKKFVPDMIVIDYADLMIPNSSKKENWEALSQVYLEIRAIAHDFKIPIWTAGQVNEEGNKSDFIDNNSASRSKGKIHHVDAAFSLQRNSDDIENDVAKIFISKNRVGGNKIKLLADMNLEKNILKIHEFNSEDGQRIQKIMNEKQGIFLNKAVKKYKEIVKKEKKV